MSNMMDCRWTFKFIKPREMLVTERTAAYHIPGSAGPLIGLNCKRYVSLTIRLTHVYIPLVIFEEGNINTHFPMNVNHRIIL